MAAAGYDERELGEPVPTDPAPLAEWPGALIVNGLTRGEHLESCPVRRGVDGEDCQGCEHEDFSTRRCEGCGSHLAGSRDALTVLDVAP